jgi:hypothetical protein
MLFTVGIHVYLILLFMFKAQLSLYIYQFIYYANICVLPTEYICFAWLSQQTATICLNGINWLVFVEETSCASCEVRTEYLYII